MIKFKVVRNCGNIKLGAMVNTYSTKNTCPTNCTLRGNGCYAENYPLSKHWKDMEVTGIDFNQYIHELASLKNRIIRLNVAGDLPGNKKLLNKKNCVLIAKNIHKSNKVICYTHYNMKYKHNRTVLKAMESHVLYVYCSTTSYKQLDEYKALGITRLTTILTEKRKDVITCLAQTKKGTQCIDCLLCAKKSIKRVIGFIPHGNRKKKLFTV